MGAQLSHNIEKLRINRETKDCLTQLVNVLQNRLNHIKFSVYVHGSIATGTYVHGKSDIDYLVVLDCELTQTLYNIIDVIHLEMNVNCPLEGSYVSKEMILDNNKPDKARIYYNKRLMWANYGYEWYFERHTLIKHGILVLGENIFDHVNDIHTNELVGAAHGLMRDEWIPAIKMFVSDETVIYGLQTVCRILYTINTNKTCDKKEAVNWVGDHLYKTNKVTLLEVLNLEDTTKVSIDHKKLLSKMVNDYENRYIISQMT